MKTRDSFIMNRKEMCCCIMCCMNNMAYLRAREQRLRQR